MAHIPTSTNTIAATKAAGKIGTSGTRNGGRSAATATTTSTSKDTGGAAVFRAFKAVTQNLVAPLLAGDPSDPLVAAGLRKLHQALMHVAAYMSFTQYASTDMPPPSFSSSSTSASSSSSSSSLDRSDLTLPPSNRTDDNSSNSEHFEHFERSAVHRELVALAATVWRRLLRASPPEGLFCDTGEVLTTP